MQAVRGLLAQLLGLTLAGSIVWAVDLRTAGADSATFVLVLVGVAALGAASFGHFVLRQPRWWVPIHLSFLPAVWSVSQAELGATVWLCGFVALALVFWGTFKGDVPLYLSSPAVVEAVSELAMALVAARPEVRVAELGAGVGTIAVALARRFPGLTLDAWERAPLPYLLCRARAARLGNLRVHRQDFWAADLSRYELVFVFLSPVVMARLSAKVRAEMRPGTIFVSAAFPCPDWVADEAHVLDDRRGTHLYVHRIA